MPLDTSSNLVHMCSSIFSLFISLIHTLSLFHLFTHPLSLIHSHFIFYLLSLFNSHTSFHSLTEIQKLAFFIAVQIQTSPIPSSSSSLSALSSTSTSSEDSGSQVIPLISAQCAFTEAVSQRKVLDLRRWYAIVFLLSFVVLF